MKGKTDLRPKGEKPVDRRVVKTRKMLLKGLTTLMKEKSVKEITVRELADLVDINRGTFYLHYRDIYDMIEKVQEEMLCEFKKVLSKYNLEEIKTDYLPVLTDVYRFITEYADMCLVLIGENGDIAFVEKLKDIVREYCLKDLIEKSRKGKEQYFEYYFSFTVAGCIGLFQEWLAGGMKDSPEEMAVLTKKLIIDGRKILKDVL